MWLVSLVCSYLVGVVFFFFKQKTAYELLISDWSSDVCSSDLAFRHFRGARFREGETEDIFRADVRPKQQAKDAGGEHMGLSRASRSAEPDMILRVGGEALTAL